MTKAQELALFSFMNRMVLVIDANIYLRGLYPLEVGVYRIKKIVGNFLGKELILKNFNNFDEIGFIIRCICNCKNPLIRVSFDGIPTLLNFCAAIHWLGQSNITHLTGSINFSNLSFYDDVEHCAQSRKILADCSADIIFILDLSGFAQHPNLLRSITLPEALLRPS